MRKMIAGVLLAAGLPLVSGAGATAQDAPLRPLPCAPLQERGAIPDAGFEDVAEGSTHDDAVDCMVYFEVIFGKNPTMFDPGSIIRRDQAASLIARLLTEVGAVLPDDAPDAFTDDEGNIHEDNINRLTEARIIEGSTATTYEPAGVLNRGQVASLIVRAARLTTGEPLGPGDVDYFTDDNGTEHEDNINTAARRRLAAGVTEDEFRPLQPVRRDEMASFVGRTYSLSAVESRYLCDGGIDGVPAPYPEISAVGADRLELFAPCRYSLARVILENERGDRLEFGSLIDNASARYIEGNTSATIHLEEGEQRPDDLHVGEAPGFLSPDGGALTLYYLTDQGEEFPIAEADY